MNVKIQLLCIILSFVYGGIIRLLLYFHGRFFLPKNRFLYFLGNFFFSFLLVLLYILLMYAINLGIFHFYFFMSMLFGYVLSNNVNKLKINQFNFFHRSK